MLGGETAELLLRPAPHTTSPAVITETRTQTTSWNDNDNNNTDNNNNNNYKIYFNKVVNYIGRPIISANISIIMGISSDN